MEYDSSRSASEIPPCDRLMRAFLALLQTDGPRTTGDAVFELFIGDPWFQSLVRRRARHAVDTHSVPSDCREDLEQEIAMALLQKARKTPDLHVDLEAVESHFGGWIWTIVDRLGIDAAHRIHRVYHSERGSLDDFASSVRQNRDIKVDIAMLVAELPAPTRTILALFNDGHTLKEVAELVGEKYSRVYKQYQDAVAFLRERLGD